MYDRTEFKNVEIQLQTNAFIVNYYVDCFERELSIIFYNLNENDKKFILNELEDNYTEWHKDGNGDYCCEEFMIDNLSPYYKNHIACVIYDNEEE